VEQGFLAGLAAFRWVAWAWMAIVLMVSRTQLARPALAYVLAAAALAVTVACTGLLRSAPDALTRAPAVLIELATGLALVTADGWAYARGHAFSLGQSLGVAWPLAGILQAGVAWGTSGGAAAGVAMGAGRAVATFGNGVHAFTGEQVFSLVSTTVLYVSAGAVSGHIANLLRRAEREITASRAREEVGRTLHDGVLQTLAAIERRASDPALARLAREQERRLRDWLAGFSSGPRDLAAALRESAARFEDAFDGRVDVVVAGDMRAPPQDRIEALAGAVGEALQNAGKHGKANRVTVFVEPEDDAIFCAVKDDGSGFDPSSTREGMGISRSIRGRLADAGGRAEIESRPGGPTEVRLWVPSA
jgi:signal transduction histidine kinase